MKIKLPYSPDLVSQPYFPLLTQTSIEFIEDQIIQLLFSTFTILMFIFQIIPYFSTKNILPNHYFFGANLMLSIAGYLIQIQYFSWQLVNIIISRIFFSTLRAGGKKTQFTIIIHLNTEVNSHLTICSQIFCRGRTC
jgi:hypothetical protein